MALPPNEKHWPTSRSLIKTPSLLLTPRTLVVVSIGRRRPREIQKSAYGVFVRTPCVSVRASDEHGRIPFNGLTLFPRYILPPSLFFFFVWRVVLRCVVFCCNVLRRIPLPCFPRAYCCDNSITPPTSECLQTAWEPTPPRASFPSFPDLKNVGAQMRVR